MSNVQVRLSFANGEQHYHEAASVELQAGELVVETVPYRRQLRIPLHQLESWSVRKADSPWERHDAVGPPVQVEG
jgi:hypothetical protein